MARRARTFQRRLFTKPSLQGKGKFAIYGLPELFNKLNALGSVVEEEPVYSLLMRGGAIPLRDKARANAPYDPKRRRGVHLRDAIIAAYGDDSRSRSGPNVMAGVDRKKAPHWAIVEYGTSRFVGRSFDPLFGFSVERERRNIARPYWRPAVAEMKPTIASNWAAGLKQIITDTLARLGGSRPQVT